MKPLILSGREVWPLVEGGKGVEWHASNWLQRTAACPFRALY